MNTQNTQNRQIYWKMSSKEVWLYLLVSIQQPTLLNTGSFWQYFSHVYSITCKFD